MAQTEAGRGRAAQPGSSEAQAAYYILQGKQIESPDWPAQYSRYALFICNPAQLERAQKKSGGGLEGEMSQKQFMAKRKRARGNYSFRWFRSEEHTRLSHSVTDKETFVYYRHHHITSHTMH